MRQLPRLALALLTMYVTLTAALVDNAAALSAQYLPINHQTLARVMIHPTLDELRNFPDEYSGAEMDPKGQRPENVEDLAVTLLADQLQEAMDDGEHPMSQHLDQLMDDMVQSSSNRMKAVNCYPGQLNWPSCLLVSTDHTSAEYEQDIADDGTLEFTDDKPAEVEQDFARRKRETTESGGQPFSRPARQAEERSQLTYQSNVMPTKIRKGFSAWGGKRSPPFGTWGGKRSPDFHSWGGKRAYNGGQKPQKQQKDPSTWEGKRMHGFHSWGGKRIPSFNSWGGKRAPSFNSWDGKRAQSFNSWGGKRAASFNSWGGKRAPSFNSWGGKRAFNSWGGKRAASFNSWGGKRAASFNSWGGKRAPAFTSWGGKRAAFNSWGGKRVSEPDFFGKNSQESSEQLLLFPADSKSVTRNGIQPREPQSILQSNWGGLRTPKETWAMPQFEKLATVDKESPEKN